MRRAGVWLIPLAIAGLASCAPDPKPEELGAQFDEAERLCLEGKFAEAVPVLKQYLIHRPGDAGAHYYLGRAYMLSQDFRPAMAEGEFQTALRLFVAQGRQSPIERFQPEYFEMMCNLDSAKVLYIQTLSIVTQSDSPAVARPFIERALGYIESARSAMPGAAEVDQIGTPIRELGARFGLS